MVLNWVRMSVVAVLLLVVTGTQALVPTRHVSQYAVKAWDMEDGLPHNLVHAVAQDDEGYLWVGSWEGAARFNGRGFTVFNARTLPGIPLAGVRTIVRDTDGAMLFGTAQHGVIRLADGVWSRLEPTVTQNLRVIALQRASDGSLWIGTDRGAHQLWPDGRLETLPADSLPYGVVYSLLELAPDDMLIGSEHGLFRSHAGRLEHMGAETGLEPVPVRALLRRSDGSVVLGGDRGAFMLPATGPAQQILDESVESLLEDRDGTLWLGITRGGLVRWQANDRQIIDATSGLLGRNSQALMEDREGLLWVGTTNGLFRIGDAPAYGLDQSRGLGDNYPRTILNLDGTMYVGHARGLDRWNGDGFDAIPIGAGEPSVLALAAASDGGLWIGAYDRGVLHVDAGPDAVARPVLSDELPSRHVRALRETADGSLWVGTTAGLVRRLPDGQVVAVPDFSGQAGSFVRGLSASADGGLWIALANGLMRWHPDETMERWFEADFPGMAAFDVLETRDGNVWVGTDQGLVRLHNGRMSRYGDRHGLPNETLFRVLQDARGMIWLASNHGAFRIDPAQFDEIDAGSRERLAVDTLDHASGMPSSQCNGGSGPAGDFDADGKLWLPTALGVAVIDPIAAAARSTARVPILIEAVEVDARVVPVSEISSLAPSVNRVVVRYIGLHLRDPPGVRYRYRMRGFDHDWIDAGNGIDAVYTNLPPGQLRFEVQAAMAPVDWSNQSDLPTASLELKRIPPFWRQPWFYVLLPFGLLALSLVGFSWHSLRARQRQRQLAQLVEVRTRELQDKNEALVEADRERESLLQRLAWQASHDALTRMPNRRAGERRLGDTIKMAGLAGTALSVALMDIDHFKRINDTWGHEAGDVVLQHVAALLYEHAGTEARNLARYGGEEFLIILPGQSVAAATERMMALVKAIARTPTRLPDGVRLDCTASIGVTQWQPGQTPSQIVVQADRLLYRAKEQGRNQVVS